MADIINHPSHYMDVAGKLEPIDFCRLFPFCFGNYCKYVLRAGHKGDKLTDLKKALVYLRWSIDEVDADKKFKKSLARNRHLALKFNNEFLTPIFESDGIAVNPRHFLFVGYCALNKYIKEYEENNISSNQ